MLTNVTGWEDTIVALATPPGVGAIGLIRISGKETFPIMQKLFTSKDISSLPTHTIHHGELNDKGKVLDDVLVSIFRGPRSYTGEDVIEISCHGSPFIQQKVIEAICSHGARLAKPGEFTQRAFLHGKLDLTQAESVADLIASNAEAARRSALQNMRGGFSNVLKELREEMITFSSLIELELDFSEEDVEFADRKKFITLLDKISVVLKRLLQSFKLGNVIKNGVSVAIVGKPNAGKSTLLNTLLNDDRAIVSEIPGTTRDTIEEVINIDGLLFRLIDTAGIRAHTHDVIESLGVKRSLEKIKDSDIVLYIFDAGDTSEQDISAITEDLLNQQKTFLLVGNKVDSIAENAASAFLDKFEIIYISARNKTGIDKLKQQLFTTVAGSDTLPENVVVTNARHYEALQQVDISLTDIREGMVQGIPADLLALDVRRCLHYLGEITGEITNEDRLDYIFSKFCIGK